MPCPNGRAERSGCHSNNKRTAPACVGSPAGRDLVPTLAWAPEGPWKAGSGPSGSPLPRPASVAAGRATGGACANPPTPAERTCAPCEQARDRRARAAAPPATSPRAARARSRHRLLKHRLLKCRPLKHRLLKHRPLKHRLLKCRFLAHRVLVHGSLEHPSHRQPTPSAADPGGPTSQRRTKPRSSASRSSPRKTRSSTSSDSAHSLVRASKRRSERLPTRDDASSWAQ